MDRHKELTEKVLSAAFKVHSALGPGLFESVYEAVLAYELSRRGLRVRRQVSIPIRYGEISFEEGFRADLIVEDILVVEWKSIEELAPVHAKQLLTQLRLSTMPVGLLLNFGEAHLRDGIRRIVNGFENSADSVDSV